MGAAKKPDSRLKLGDGSDMELSYDYRVLFTNEVLDAYMNIIPSSASKERDSEARGTISRQMQDIATLYAATICYIYPNRPLFKKAIDSDSELSANFEKAKQWVSSNGFDRLADNFVSAIAGAYGGKVVV